MMDTREGLGRYITPKLDEARLARQRAAIAERMGTGRRPRWFLLLAPALCLAAVVFLWLHSYGDKSGPLAGTVVETPAGASLPITLVDGSHLRVDPETKLSLMTLQPKDIRLNLDHGGVDFEVTHVDHREFVVMAADYEVRVLGTHFSVRVHPAKEGRTLEVQVARGRVRVTRIGDAADVRVLGAGETWSTTPPPVTLQEPPSVHESSLAPTVDETLEEGMRPTASPSSSSTAAPGPRVLGAKELWSQAESARASKRFQEEAEKFDALRKRHRSDPRAGLAAFELGRLRQDTLHDPAGAAEAFADAVVLAPHGPFREDAEARRVEALDAAGRRELCVEARASFLARYPASVHRPRVSAGCSSR